MMNNRGSVMLYLQGTPHFISFGWACYARKEPNGNHVENVIPKRASRVLCPFRAWRASHDKV